jgi:hypothetical protein
VATFTQLASGNWRVQVRRKTRYVAETFRRRKDGEEWALEMERNIDRNGSSKRTKRSHVWRSNRPAPGDFAIPHPSTNRDAKGTTLYSRGPDIKEIETAMRF